MSRLTEAMRRRTTSLATEATKHLYFPLLDRIKRTPFEVRLAEAKDHERLTPGSLRALSDALLVEALTAAAVDVPHYARCFRDARVDARSLRGVDDLSLLPLLTKADLFERRGALRSHSHPGRLFRGSTSGSTGIAMEFHQDSEQHAWVEAVQWRGRAWWGVARGDAMVVLWSRPAANTRLTSAVAWAKNRLRNAVQFDTFQELGEREVDRILEAIELHRPRCIYGYGSSLGKLALELDRRMVRFEGERRPSLVEYTADHMYPAERSAAESVFGVPVATAYGSSECGGVAQQCRQGRLHIAIDHVIVEFLREDGTAAAPGERARIVITQLHNRAMPLIRFEVGDLGTYHGDPCPCGHPFPTMALDVGKTVDLITTSYRRNVSAHLLDYINLHLMKLGVRGIRQFRVEQVATDAFALTIVKDSVFDPRCVTIFVERMREYLGEGIAVQTEFVDSIPLEATGKRRYFKKAAGLSSSRT